MMSIRAQVAAGLIVVSWAGGLQAPRETRLALVSAIDKDGGAVQALEPDEVVIEKGSSAGQILSVTPASYPLAIILDTSSFARSDFQTMRDAAHRFVGGLSGRAVALYTSGAPACLVVDFTTDVNRFEDAIAHTFAQPTGTPRRFDAIIDAARGLSGRSARVTRIIVLSAGGADSSGRAPRDVLEAVLESRSIVDVIDLRQTVAEGNTPAGSAYNPHAPMPRLRTDSDADVLRELSARTLGRYERIVVASAYSTMLDRIRTQLLSEALIEYAVPAGTSGTLRVGVRLPGVIVRGLGLDEVRPAR